MERYTETQTRRILTRQYGASVADKLIMNAKTIGAIYWGSYRVAYATGKGYGPEGSFTITD